MAEEQKIVKIITPQTCPCCGKEIFVSSQFMMPFVSGIFNEEDIKKAKEEIKERLKEIQFVNEEEKENIMSYIDKTLLDSSDIDPLVKQISLDQTEKISKQINK